MSDDVPFEIQAEIMKQLPIRSLITFRSVCKAWKTHIDGSDFIRHYGGGPHEHHILVSDERLDDYERKYVLIADDDTFPQNKVSLTVPIVLQNPRIIGSSHGLLCLLDDFEEGNGKVVIWNLSIRKAVAVVLGSIQRAVLGFGVCRETNDPKIVRIRLADTSQVEVFNLSTGSWRSPCNSLRASIRVFDWRRVVVGGFLYWLAVDNITVDGEIESRKLIISFDMTREEFGEVNLPTSLTHAAFYFSGISKLKESLVLIDYGPDVNNPVCDVWRMKDGDPKAFSKLYNVSDNADSLIRPVGFRKTGEAIVEYLNNSGRLFGYETHSKRITNLGINGGGLCYVCPYMETLLLLDQPNLTVYDGM